MCRIRNIVKFTVMISSVKVIGENKYFTIPVYRLHAENDKRERERGELNWSVSCADPDIFLRVGGGGGPHRKRTRLII